MQSYRIKLFRYRQVNGYFEEQIIAQFQPAKVNGFGWLVNTIKKYVKINSK